MVELRKRKEAPAAQPPPPKKSNSVKSSTSSRANGSVSGNPKVAVGDVITVEGFGGEVETQDGEKTTLKELVDKSGKGVVLFTYPKASTPGCTTQACLFRDSYSPLTATGFAIYGLSSDSPKSNTTFKTKQNLPYTLLCDPAASLIGAIGMKKPPKGTTRGVFVVDKEGKVLAAEAGGPAATVEVVKKIVGLEPAAPADGAMESVSTVVEGSKVEKEVEDGKTSAHEVEQAQPPAPAVEEPAFSNGEGARESTAPAEVAAQVADSAKKLDGTPAGGTPAAGTPKPA